MITALEKYNSACFDCRDFRIGHNEAGYYIYHKGIPGYPSIPESEAIALVNEYLERNQPMESEL